MKQPSRVLSAEERIAWLRLMRTENVGPATFRSLLQQFGTAVAALEALPMLARRGGRRDALRVCSRSAAEREIAGLTRIGGRLIAAAETEYPSALAAIDAPPPLIAVRGHVHVLETPSVAVVGARNASTLGRKLAESMAKKLTEAGLCVVSGLARGIDAAAHRGALPGPTVACMAGGVDIVYPSENEELYGRIIASGAAVSEMPLGLSPMARHFPRRNRLIAGLSLGTVVIEAARRSGSLITARWAADMGREVMAVPGSPLDPRAGGCNQLLKDGAALIESADDVLEALAGRRGVPVGEPPGKDYEPIRNEPLEPPPDAHETILELLSPVPTAVDELVRDSQFSAAVVLTVLLDLEIAGRIERHPGNKVSIA